MERFGYLSPLLSPPVRSRFLEWIPEKWRYYNGPVQTGAITGLLPKEEFSGLGWRLPENSVRLWKEHHYPRLWHNFFHELLNREVKVIGLDASTEFHPPQELRNDRRFPGVSDGKALELLLFLNRFRNILKNYGIPPQKARAAIIWEEGNLGIACARLVAREVRFLTLISPNPSLLERAAGLILSETGISSEVFLTPPSDIPRTRIIIKCGRLKLYQNSVEYQSATRRMIRCELFQRHPPLPMINLNLPLKALQHGRDHSLQFPVPLYPALGETILRLYAGLQSGFWYGPELTLERVLRLAQIFRELDWEISL